MTVPGRCGPTSKLAALLLSGALIITACGSGSGSKGPGVASVSPSGSASSSPGAPRASMLAYARCMRAHGLTDFPDPGANGNLQLNADQGSNLDPNSVAFKAADAACKSLLPAPQAAPGGAKAQNLRYARCMRAHGISDFPDPKPDGTLQIQSSPGSDLDPNNPQYKAANDACKKYQPNGGAGGSAQTGSGS
jgi:hypothetical protein